MQVKENKKMKLFDKIKKLFSVYGEPPYKKHKLATSFAKDEPEKKK